MSDAPRVWLITSCSSGIGREIALAALAAGDRVAVTARNPESVADLVASAPSSAFGVALDVTDSAQIRAAVTATEARFGRIDVLVNNAGYGYVSSVEEGEDAEVRRMFETNFFGAIELIKAVLPGMRARRDGYLVNMSSTTGFVSMPGNVYYSTSKFALESLSEGLAKELAPFGIRVTVVGAGTFRTDWSGRSMRETRTPIDDYASSVGERRELIRSMDGRQPGDPAKLGEVVVDLAELEDPPPRLVLGRDAYEAYRGKLRELDAMLTEWESTILATDFDEAS